MFSFGAPSDVPNVEQLFAESDHDKDGFISAHRWFNAYDPFDSSLFFFSPRSKGRVQGCSAQASESPSVPALAWYVGFVPLAPPSPVTAFDSTPLFAYTRYLVCVNGSLEADRAVQLAVRQARERDELLLVYVHPPLDASQRPPHVSDEAWAREDAKRAEKVRGLLEQYRSRLGVTHKHLSCKTLYVEGPLLKKLTELTDVHETDVLILSRHHYSHSKEGYDALIVVRVADVRTVVTSWESDMTCTRSCSTFLAVCW